MSLHLVFSAECNDAMTWQSIGLFHSFKRVGQSGNITRLLACSDEQMKTYTGLDAGPTFVHHNMRFGHPLVQEVGIPNYNKPASVMFFLEQVDVREDYIALLDADMVLREPLDPIALGAKPGVVVSAEYSYLVGTDKSNATHEKAFARRFLDDHELPLMVRCGGFHIFHREDIRKIAPLWVEFTRRVREFAKSEPEQYLAESFLDWEKRDGVTEEMVAVRRRQGVWQAEMYGYVFGAARVGVSHVVRRDTMLYPGYVPLAGTLPQILHYGSDYRLDRLPHDPAKGTNRAGGDDDAARAPTLPAEDLYFNKMNHVHLDVYAQVRSGCVAADQLFFFGRPPPPRRADGTARSRRDLLCIEHLQILNSGLCEFYRQRCGGTNSSARTAIEPEGEGYGEANRASAAVVCPEEHAAIGDVLRECRDEHDMCAQFARSGECTRNPKWMLSWCAASCRSCFASRTSRQRLFELQPWYDKVGPLASAYEDSSPDADMDAEADVPRLGFDGRPIQDGEVDHSVEEGGGHLAMAMRSVAEAAAFYGCAESACLLYSARVGLTSVHNPDASAPDPLTVKWQDVPLGASGISLSSFGGRLACDRIEGPLLYAGTMCGPPQPLQRHSFKGSVLLAIRGECTFAAKARHAHAAGAAALLVFDAEAAPRADEKTPTDGDDHVPLAMAGDAEGRVPILVVGISRLAGETLRHVLEESIFQSIADAKRSVPPDASHAQLAEIIGRAASESPIKFALEGLEIVIQVDEAKNGDASADSSSAWRVVPPTTVSRGCGRGNEDEDVELDASQRGQVHVTSGGKATPPLGTSCIPLNRSFYMYDRAFTYEQWGALVDAQRCPPRA